MGAVSNYIFDKTDSSSSRNSSGGMRRSSNDDNITKRITACVGGGSSWWEGQRDRKIFIKEETFEWGFQCFGSPSFPTTATKSQTFLPPTIEPPQDQQQHQRNSQYFPFVPADPIFPLPPLMEQGMEVCPSFMGFFEGFRAEIDLSETVGTDGAGSSAAVSSSVGNAVEKSCLLAIALTDDRQPGASITKAARSKRRMARQKCTRFSHSSRSSPAAALFLSSNRLGKKSSTASMKGHMISHPIPENRGMKILVQKELRNSDVSPLGRVVLPKRDSEANLPYLTAKEGIQITLVDVDTSQTWNMRYRFWPNNKSRMYVLENTGEFVKQHGLRSSDYIAIYQDEFNRLFISARKAERQSSSRSGIFELGECSQKQKPVKIEAEETPKDYDNLSLSLSNKSSTVKMDEGSSSNQKNKGMMMEGINDDFGCGFNPSLSNFHCYDFGQLASLAKFDECDLSLYDDLIVNVVEKAEEKPAVHILPENVVQLAVEEEPVVNLLENKGDDKSEVKPVIKS